MPFKSFSALRRFFHTGSHTTRDPQANNSSVDIGQPDATSDHRVSTMDRQESKTCRSPQHQLAEFLPPKKATSRATESPSTVSQSVRSERRRSLADLPPNVLHKLGTDLKSRPAVINLALASPSVQVALLPAAKNEKLDFLKEMARSARDLESFRLVLRSSQSMPSALHISLVEDLIASLPGLAKADGSFFQMQAAAADAADGFRLLASHIADLPSPQRTSLSITLAPHLRLLPVDERYDAMETLLKEAREHASRQDRFEIISCFALGMSQFNYQDLPKVAQVLINEADTFPPEDCQRLEEIFRRGMICKMLDTDRARIEQLLARLGRNDARPLSS